MQTMDLFSSLTIRTRTPFVLKKKDEILIKFDYASTASSGGEAVIKRVLTHDKAQLPYGFDNSDEWLTKWIQRRFIPKNRQFVYKLMNSLDININETVSLLTITFGLSLTDDYWILPEDQSDLRWKDYNLYQNEFSETLARVAFTGYDVKVAGIASSPEFTTDGALPKCWRRVNGEVFLYKGGTSGSINAGLEPYSEFYAAQVAEALGINYVPYKLEYWHNSISSVCPLFTSEDVSFIPMHVAFPGVQGTQILNTGTLMGLYREMVDLLLLDCLILNHDRHLGNFGVLRDNSTGTLLGMAPAFDNGMSLAHQAWGDDFTDLEGKYFAPRSFTFLDLSLNQIPLIRSLFDSEHKKKLRSMLGFSFKMGKKYNLPPERIKYIEEIVRNQARKLLK